MPVHNSFIGEIFNELADLLEIEGANSFRVRAYRNAARVVSGWPQNLSAILRANGELPKLPGLGKDLSEKVAEIISTGKLKALQEERGRVPRELSSLLKIPGLGPKRVLLLKERLGVKSIRDLRSVAREGRIREIRGFGEKTERRILEEVGREENRPTRIFLSTAEQVAEPLLGYMRELSSVREIVVAGSFRRRQETVGDLDVLVSVADKTLAKCAREVSEKFVRYDEVETVLARGESKSSVLLRSGIQVDLRVVAERSFGAALHYFTGSKSHNIAVRTLGVKRGLKINEYGVFRREKRIAGKTEIEVYRQVGLPYIEPELRESRGEIEAARENRLPKLVRLEEIRGDLHAHTRATDGRTSLEQMAESARRRGYEYLAVTDHSRHLTVAKGLTPRLLLAQNREIDRLNAKLRGIRLLKSIEVDILEDGKLDLPDEVLAELDMTVCSIHFKFDLKEVQQTERILRAMDNPYFHILGHPTGRLIGSRAGYEIDLERVMTAAKERGCILELNSQPERMDLTDTHCKMAKEIGVRLAISTDAHNGADLGFMSLGVSQARRGWIEAGDVVNTRPWRELERLLRRK